MRFFLNGKKDGKWNGKEGAEQVYTARSSPPDKIPARAELPKIPGDCAIS